MPIHVDPDQTELRYLRRVGPWRGLRVLDVGCGEGRLTLRLARLGAQVLGVDPLRERLKTARASLPEKYRAQVRYRQGSAGALGLRPASFDRVVFSWAL